MKYGISIVAVAALMLAAPPFGDTNWIGDGSDTGLWNTATNWDIGLPNGGEDTFIQNGNSVTLSGIAGAADKVFVNNRSSLTISTNLNMGNDILVDSGGQVTLTAGTTDLGNNKIKIGDDDDTGSPSFFMDGGTFTMEDKLEIYGTGLFQYKAGSFTVTDNIEITGTFKVVGYDAAGLLSFEGMEAGNTSGTFEFVPNASGEITPVTMSAASLSKTLVVDLANVTAATELLLFDASVTQATFNSVTVNNMAAGLSYTLAYDGGSGTDVVLSVVPEPATMSLLAIGGLAIIRRRKRA